MPTTTAPMRVQDLNDTSGTLRIKYLGIRSDSGEPHVIRFTEGHEDRAVFLTPAASYTIMDCRSGFEWGNLQPRFTHQLAIALLLDATDPGKKALILKLYPHFASEFVQQFDRAGFAITDITIRDWIKGKLARDAP